MSVNAGQLTLGNSYFFKVWKLITKEWSRDFWFAVFALLSAPCVLFFGTQRTQRIRKERKEKVKQLHSPPWKHYGECHLTHPRKQIV